MDVHVSINLPLFKVLKPRNEFFSPFPLPQTSPSSTSWLRFTGLLSGGEWKRTRLGASNFPQGKIQGLLLFYLSRSKPLFQDLFYTFSFLSSAERFYTGALLLLGTVVLLINHLCVIASFHFHVCYMWWRSWKPLKNNNILKLA